MIRVRAIKNNELLDMEKLYNKSVFANKDGFIQQLEKYKNIKDFVIDTNNSGGGFLGVFKDNKIIGMGGIIKKSEKLVELAKLHVDYNEKGNGYGCLLAKKLEEYANLLGYDEIELHVTKTQNEAICLYNKLGYQKTNERLYEIQIDHKSYAYDTVFMRKEIRFYDSLV